MNRWRWPLLVALALPLGAAGFPPVPKAKDKKATAAEIAKAIQGTWEVTSLERAGAKEVKTPPYQMRLIIEGKTLSRYLKIKEKELKSVDSTIAMDTTKSPTWFDVTTATSKISRPAMKGLIKVEGDKLIWVYAMTGDRPTKIDGELIDRQYRYTLKRVQK